MSETLTSLIPPENDKKDGALEKLRKGYYQYLEKLESSGSLSPEDLSALRSTVANINSLVVERSLSGTARYGGSKYSEITLNLYGYILLDESDSEEYMNRLADRILHEVRESPVVLVWKNGGRTSVKIDSDDVSLVSGNEYNIKVRLEGSVPTTDGSSAATYD